MKVWLLNFRVVRFNPRVRGTCLVRTYKNVNQLLTIFTKFQSPCAGNMFGKT